MDNKRTINLPYIILYRDEQEYWDDYCSALGEDKNANAIKVYIADTEAIYEEEE